MPISKNFLILCKTYKMETVFHPGVYYETSNPRGKETLEAKIRAELRKNGYPTTSCYDPSCSQPDICAKIADCEGGGSGVSCFDNGLTLLEGEIDCAVLGGSLTQNTGIDTETFTFQIIKDNVAFQILNTAPPYGSGETARFYTADGTGSSAQVGVYTYSGGGPRFTLHGYTDSSDFYSLIDYDSVTQDLNIEAGLVANDNHYTVKLNDTRIFLGNIGPVLDTGIEVLHDGGNVVVALRNLPTHTSNADAISAGLSVDTLYRLPAGSDTVIGIVT